MTKPALDWNQLIGGLQQQDLLDESSAAGIARFLEKSRQSASMPWFIKLIIAAGAWVASIFFLTFLDKAHLIPALGKGWLPWGVGFILAALVLHRFGRVVFFNQLALAFSVTGHFMALVSVYEFWHRMGAVTLAALLLCAGLYGIQRDSLHRFLSCLMVFLLALIAARIDFHSGAHFLVLAEVLGLAGLAVATVAGKFRPVVYAAALALPITCLVMTTSGLHRLTPAWPSRIILTAALAGLCLWIGGGRTALKEEPIRLAVLFVLLLGAVTSPGILAGLGLLIFGYATLDKALIAVGTVFFPVFIVVYYYDLQVDLASKSLLLLASGLVLLAGWFLLNRRPWVRHGKTPSVETLSDAAAEGAGEGARRQNARWALVVLGLGLALALGSTNYLIVTKAKLLHSGQVVLLELVPADHRSPLQGDYMALRYEVSRLAMDRLGRKLPADGCIVVRTDPRGVAEFARLDEGKPLGAGEYRLRYRQRGSELRLGAEAFFFQSGQAKKYGRARYGELRVAPDGESVLAGLRDEDLAQISPDLK
jgi:uncharacterized membrane-anchored protein